MAGKSLLRMTEWKTKSVCKSLSARKLFVAKKVCAFELCPVLIQKYTKSFGGKNLALCLRFSPIKSQYIFCFTPDAVQIRRFFFLSTTLHAQKKVKEIAYILTCYQALLPSAILFFLLFVNEIKGNDNIMEMKFLFVFIFTYWIQFLSNK